FSRARLQRQPADRTKKNSGPGTPPMIDATHDPRRKSFVESANGHPEFPIQNLPFGIFSPRGAAARGGVAIGDEILDLAAASEQGLFSGNAAVAAQAASGPLLNPFFPLPTPTPRP